jgi:heat shock protein HslJ
VTHRLAVAALAATIVIMLAGCAVGADDPPGSGGQDGWPTGRTFLSTAIVESGQPKTLVEGTRIRLSFDEDGRVSAHAGCNHMGGVGRLDAGTLVVTELATTEMGCPGGLHEQDEWIAEVLTSGPTMGLAGDVLTLTGATTTITLLDREVADPDRPLVGTAWVIDSIITGDAVSSVPSDEPAVFSIDSSGAFHATTGCVGGQVRGQVEIAGDRVILTVTDELPCAGAGNGLDEAVRAILQGELTYEITASRLTLTAPGGDGLGMQADA